jgi:hypothetical protein
MVIYVNQGAENHRNVIITERNYANGALKILLLHN